MLRLLAQRGEEGYDDVAALMGLSVEEVRAKVAEALAGLAEEGALAPTRAGEQAAPREEPPAPAAEPAAPPAPEPPAMPEPELPAQPESEPESPATAADPAPAAMPALAPDPETAPAAAARRKPSAPPKISLPSGDGPRAAIVAAAFVLVAIVAVLIVSGGDGGTDSSTTSASNTTSNTTSGEAGEPQTTPTSNADKVTKAVLKPVDGGSASGEAIFGRVKNSLALQVIAKGLPPNIEGSTEYTVWLAQSAQRMLPLASTGVKADGRIGAQFEVPTEVLAYLANGTFDQLVITRTSNSALEASLAQATKEERAPEYTGTEVLRGTVRGPIVGAAKKESE